MASFVPEVVPLLYHRCEFTCRARLHHPFYGCFDFFWIGTDVYVPDVLTGRCSEPWMQTIIDISAFHRTRQHFDNPVKFYCLQRVAYAVPYQGYSKGCFIAYFLVPIEH